jgi:hypothetical protein
MQRFARCCQLFIRLHLAIFSDGARLSRQERSSPPMARVSPYRWNKPAKEATW